MKEKSSEQSKSLLSKYFEDSAVLVEHPSMTIIDGAAYRLQITLRDGAAYSYPYSLLYRVKHEPGEELTLTFSGDATFTLRGINLHLLFDALNRQQVESIRHASIDGTPPWNAVSVPFINMEAATQHKQKVAETDD